MPFKRRREGKTDYKKRLVLLKSRKPRFVVRKSLKYIRINLVEFANIGDRTVASATSHALKKLGWDFALDNIPAAYLTGLMAGKVAKAKGVNEAVLDMGLYISTKGSRVYAAVKGAVDAGLKINCDPEMFPAEDRLRGEHTARHNEKFKEMPKQFEIVKEKVEKEKVEKLGRKE